MYKIVLAIRYLLKRRISYFSIAAVALCVFVVLVVITVLSGLTTEFEKNTHLSIGDCVVSTKSLVGFGYYSEFMKILEDADFVEAVCPVIKNYALMDATLESGSQAYIGSSHAEIMGVDAATYGRVTGFGGWLFYHKGDFEHAFEPSYDPNLPGCIPGVGLLFSRDLQGNYNIPEGLSRLRLEISCVPLTAKGALAKAGAGEVSTKTFYYSDTVQSGLAKIDGGVIYLPFDEAQRLCGMQTIPGRVNAIHVKFKPAVSLQKGCDQVKDMWVQFVEENKHRPQANLLNGVMVQSWASYSRSIIAAVETERTMMMIIFGMIGVITVFIVFVVLYMIVSHKAKDIGILKSVGASNGNVMVLFLYFAFLVGAVGSAIGAVGGWRFLVHINQIENWLFEHFGFQLWDRQLYAIGDIPNDIDLKVLATVIISAIVACLAGGFFPSRQAANLKPVESLQVGQI
jgi:ABC-type lipoprotein release transport system permease subunit